MAVVIPCNHWSKAVWRSPDGRESGSFEPVGKFSLAYKSGRTALNPRLNPRPSDSADKPVLSARLFFGFGAGATPTWSIKDLLPIVKRVRKEQIDATDSAICYQNGVLSHMEKDVTVTEDGVQIVILNLQEAVTNKQFEDQLVELGEAITRELKQRQIIVEMQKNGLFQTTMGIVP
jgi:hypothetical protein